MLNHLKLTLFEPQRPELLKSDTKPDGNHRQNSTRAKPPWTNPTRTKPHPVLYKIGQNPKILVIRIMLYKF